MNLPEINEDLLETTCVLNSEIGKKFDFMKSILQIYLELVEVVAAQAVGQWHCLGRSGFNPGMDLGFF